MSLRQDRVLGALLGMGIGDALGMPVEGWTRERVAERFGRIDRYYPRVFDDGAELAAGEFTDDSEGVLCIVESFTASSGELDPENILARLSILARGEARRWMNPATREAIEFADQGVISNARVTGDVAARGIALGLIAAGDPAKGKSAIAPAASVLAEMTHANPLAATSIGIVAEAIRAVALGEIGLNQISEQVEAFDFTGEFSTGLRHVGSGIAAQDSFEGIAARAGFGDDAVPVVLSALAAAAMATDFESGVVAAASLGGAADSRAAIAGAILGAATGTAGLPQPLIDGLEGRMYLMLAAPWFFQTIQLKGSFWRSGA